MIDKKYRELLQDILENGVENKDRTGTGTISVFGRQIRHKMSDGFPLLTTKKMYWKGIVTELLWFLRGDTNIKYLVDNGCNIWNGDAYKNYQRNCDESYGPYGVLLQSEFINKIKTDDEFAKKWGDLGSIYGKQWRRWSTYPNEYGEYESNPIDQIQNLIEQLKTNPDSRRLMVSAWNVGELEKMVLPPCHYGFQVYTRELSLEERTTLFCKKTGQKDWKKRVQATIEVQGEENLNKEFEKHNIPKRAISLMWNQRSVDTFLGLPFNIASYGLLLEIIAKEVNMVPDELIGNLGDVHLYKNHIEQAKEQLSEIHWKERKEMLTDPSDIREFGNISPFTDKVINYWLDLKKIPYSRRMPFPLPKVLINNGDIDNNGTPFIKSILDGYDITDFELVNYKSHPPIKAPLSN